LLSASQRRVLNREGIGRGWSGEKGGGTVRDVLFKSPNGWARRRELNKKKGRKRRQREIRRNRSAKGELKVS